MPRPAPPRPLFRKMLIMLALLSWSAASLHGQPASDARTALLIANGAYTTLGRLPQPVPEAQQLKATLDRLGFATTLLTDASREDMLDALSDFRRDVDVRGGLAFFHYGGHAVQVQGQNYLIPATASIADESRVASRAVSLEEITKAINGSRASSSVIVLDSCRDNPLPSSAGRSATRGLKVLPSDTQTQGSIIVYSAQAGAVAKDGLFTPALTRNLDKPVSFSEVLQEVAREVLALSAGEQRPFTYADLSMPPIYLAGRQQVGFAAAQPRQGEQPAPPAADAGMARFKTAVDRYLERAIWVVSWTEEGKAEPAETPMALWLEKQAAEQLAAKRISSMEYSRARESRKQSLEQVVGAGLSVQESASLLTQLGDFHVYFTYGIQAATSSSYLVSLKALLFDRTAAILDSFESQGRLVTVAPTRGLSFSASSQSLYDAPELRLALASMGRLALDQFEKTSNGSYRDRLLTSGFRYSVTLLRTADDRLLNQFARGLRAGAGRLEIIHRSEKEWRIEIEAFLGTDELVDLIYETGSRIPGLTDMYLVAQFGWTILFETGL